MIWEYHALQASIIVYVIWTPTPPPSLERHGASDINCLRLGSGYTIKYCGDIRVSIASEQVSIPNHRTTTLYAFAIEMSRRR